MTATQRVAQLLECDPSDKFAVAEALQGLSMAPIKVVRRKIKIVAATTVNDTGFDFPTAGLILWAGIRVTTFEATATTKTVDVGLLASETGGDEDGLIDGVSVATTTGTKTGALPVTDGSSQNFFAASPTLGALFIEGELGADGAGTAGVATRRFHNLNGTAKSLTYTLGSNNFAELVGHIVCVYMDFTQLI